MFLKNNLELIKGANLLKFKKKLVSRIKELREKLNISQQKLAKLVGVSRQTIYYLEKGIYNPKLTLSFKLSEILKKSIDEIFFFEPKIREILGNKTIKELEDISMKSKVNPERILKLKYINDKELDENFTEQELLKITRAMGVKFEDLFDRNEYD